MSSNFAPLPPNPRYPGRVTNSEEAAASDVDERDDGSEQLPPVSYRKLTPDKDLKEKVALGEVMLKFVPAHSTPGVTYQIVERQNMDFHDFQEYRKNVLKKCRPPFCYDEIGLETGNEHAWYRELKKSGNKEEPPQKRAKTEETEVCARGRSRKKRAAEPPPPRPKQAKLEEQRVSVHEELARNINVDGLLFADIKRIISALRTTDNALKPVAMNIYQRIVPASIKATLSVASNGSVRCVLTDVRPSFEDLWVKEDPPEFERSFLPYPTQVLMHYSRASNARKHSEICARSLWGKDDWISRELSQVDLRDFIIHSLGDLFVTVEGEDAVFIWWQNSWTTSKGPFHRLSHIIMEAILELYKIRQHEIWRLQATEWIAQATDSDDRRDCWISESRPDPLDALLHSLAKDKRNWFRAWVSDGYYKVDELCKMILKDIARETGVGEIISDDTAFCWKTTSDDGVDITWTSDDIKELSKLLLDDTALTELLSKHNSSQNNHVRQLVVEQLHAYSLPRDPFDRKDHLFCFTNATFDLNLGTFVPVSKFDFCQMNCGRPWISPMEEERKTMAGLWESILPREQIRRGYASVCKRGLSGTRDEHFVLANGGGRNGKGVLDEQMSYTVGHYGVEAHLDLITKPLKSGANPEAANLHRKRWIIFSEPENGFSESLRLANIKKLTGGDTLAARGCHSNDTEKELNGSIVMECNKPPPITGDKGEAAQERVRLFPFEMTFTDDAEKLAANPEKFKPKDESLKSKEFKEKHRCAFFEYVVANGGDAPYFPHETKQLGVKYLADNDELSLWIIDNYEKTERTNPVEHFISIKDMYEKYKFSDRFFCMTNNEKKNFSETKFKEDVKKNLLLKDYFVEHKKVKLAPDGKYNGKVGICHFREKPEDIDDTDKGKMPSGFVMGKPVQTTFG